MWVFRVEIVRCLIGVMRAFVVLSQCIFITNVEETDLKICYVMVLTLLKEDWELM